MSSAATLQTACQGTYPKGGVESGDAASGACPGHKPMRRIWSIHFITMARQCVPREDLEQVFRINPDGAPTSAP